MLIFNLRSSSSKSANRAACRNRQWSHGVEISFLTLLIIIDHPMAQNGNFDRGRDKSATLFFMGTTNGAAYKTSFAARDN
jgi:hypothetical protein